MLKMLFSTTLIATAMVLTAGNPMKFNLQLHLPQSTSTTTNVTIKTLQQILNGTKTSDSVNKTTELGFIISRPPRRNDKQLKALQTGRERVQKPPSSYSWTYLSRKTYYIPLWYNLYFGWYLLWVLFRSVRLHKVGQETKRRRRSMEVPICGYFGRQLDICENILYKSIQKYTNLTI